MKKIFFTPGPSQLYPTVSHHIQTAIAENIPSISHRGEKFQQLFSSTGRLLKTLLKIPDDYQIFFLSSATEAMERIIQNTVEKRSLHFVNGAFSDLFYKTAVDYKKNAEKFEVPPGEGFDFSKIKILTKPELFCFTHNETSTGVVLKMDEVYKVRKSFPESFIALDVVSSVPYGNIDYAQLDCVFFSVQKGFGLPAGLGVLVVSPKAIDKALYLHKKGLIVGSHHSFLKLLSSSEKNQTPETPNVLNMYLLHNVIEDMLAKRLNTINHETKQKAQLLYEFFEKNHNTYSVFVKDRKFRSPTVIVVEIKNGSKPLLEYLKSKGMIVGSGYKEFKDKHIRIANFPAVSLYDVKALLYEIECKA